MILDTTVWRSKKIILYLLYKPTLIYIVICVLEIAWRIIYIYIYIYIYMFVSRMRQVWF